MIFTNVQLLTDYVTCPSIVFFFLFVFTQYYDYYTYLLYSTFSLNCLLNTCL